MKPPRTARPPRRQSGIALTVVLWVIALLSVVAANFAYSMRTETNVTRNNMAHTQARHLAEAGVRAAVWAMSHPDPEARWRSDGSSRRLAIGDGAVQVSVRREAGLIDLNKAPRAVLAGLLAVFEVEPGRRDQIVDAIEDWRDKDDLRRVSGAEDREYVAAGRNQGAKDGPFDAVSELQTVLGMTPQLYRRLEPFLTVHAGATGIDTGAAPLEVLLAQPGIDAAGAQAILARRDGTATRAAGGGIYRITARAAGPGGGSFSLRAVVRITTGKKPVVNVLEWAEHR